MTSEGTNSVGGSSGGASVSTSTSLLARVKEHDPEAWQRLVELYGPVVYDWCRQSGLREEDAADVGQDVFAAVTRHISGFRRDRPNDSFRGWLWTVTRSKINDHFRRLGDQVQAKGGTDAQQQLAQVPEEPPESSATTLHSPAASPLEHRAMEMVRASVEDQTWEAFWLVTVEGRSAADVAEQLGISPAAVYDAKYRVRKRIRQELGDLID